MHDRPTFVPSAARRRPPPQPASARDVSAATPAPAAPSGRAWTTQRVLSLQRAVGNQATAGLIGSAGLQSRRLSASPRMVAAHRNSPPLSAADQPEDVALLQRALADVGFAPADSRGPFHGFDGIWGPKTTKAVRAFQQAHDVRPVGGFEAGKKTLSALDALLDHGPAPPDEQGEMPRLPDDPEDRFRQVPILDASAEGPDLAAATTQAPGEPVVARQPDHRPQHCRNDLDAAINTAKAGSPSFARAFERVKRKFSVAHGDTSETNMSAEIIFIACNSSQDDAVYELIYEVNNAQNKAIFDAETRDKSKFRSGEEWARRVIYNESITVMHAARMAEETGRVYKPKAQGLVRPFLIRTPDGLDFKSGAARDKAHQAVFDELFRNGRTQSGELAREAYKKLWEDWKKLQER